MAEHAMFDDMMTPLYYINTLSYIFIVLAEWNNSPFALLGHIFLIPSQPLFVLTS